MGDEILASNRPFKGSGSVGFWRWAAPATSPHIRGHGLSQIEAVVHVSWELPFPLRLAPKAFFVWEPEYGLALLDPRPRVGDLIWSRTSTVLPATAVFKDLGPPNKHAYPDCDYLLTAKLTSGEELPTVKLIRGPAGGFIEPRAYTHVNLFLGLRHRESYHDPSVMERAGCALNNVLDVYRFVTMDPLVRSVHVDKDCYYTMQSVAELPESSRTLFIREILRSVGDLAFGHVIGVNRSHTIGLNSFEDLFVGSDLPEPNLDLLLHLSLAPHKLEMFHQLVFSAIRRLKRHEEALSVLDAQSSFEALVAVLVREDLQRKGVGPTNIEIQLGLRGPLHSLRYRLKHLDLVSANQVVSGTTPPAFLNSSAEREWRSKLYALRNRIIHEGLRTVSFAEAKAALVAGLHALHAIQSLHPAFERQLTWSGTALDLQHIEHTAGRISRLFEA